MNAMLELKPSPNMIKLYHIYMLLGISIGVLSWALPLALVMPRELLPIYLALILIPLLIIILVYMYWIRKYYNSIIYRIEEDKVVSVRGVWWIRESSIPFSKVNNVVITQGPLQRLLNLMNIGVHTAAMGLARPEVMLSNLSPDMARKVRAMILERAKVLTEERRKSLEEQILEELRNIRNTLELIRESLRS